MILAVHSYKIVPIHITFLAVYCRACCQLVYYARQLDDHAWQTIDNLRWFPCTISIAFFGVQTDGYCIYREWFGTGIKCEFVIFFGSNSVICDTI